MEEHKDILGYGKKEDQMRCGFFFQRTSCPLEKIKCINKYMFLKYINKYTLA